MGDPATGLTSGGASFPRTRWSVIRDAGDPESPTSRTSLNDLSAVYWRPVYAYFRLKWRRSPEEAGDLTQDFFQALTEKDVLGRLTADHGRFRSYIMASLDNYARLRHRHDGRQKRGGGLVRVPIEDPAALEPSGAATPEQAFLREWACSVLDEARRRLERACCDSGRETAFRIFERHDLDAPAGEDLSYEALAQRFGVSVAEVTRLLYRCRQEFRETVLDLVADTVSDRRDAEAELREILEGPGP